MESDAFKELLVEYYKKEVNKLERLTQLLHDFGLEEKAFDPNLNLNKFKREMVKFIETLGD